MPTQTITRNERAAPAPRSVPEPTRAEDGEVLRKLALQHLENVRKFKFYVSAYLLALVVLTPVWVVTEYMQADGWPERLSDQANPGDWNPWILWVALVGGFIVGIAALRAYFVRGETEDDIEREIGRLKSTR